MLKRKYNQVCCKISMNNSAINHYIFSKGRINTCTTAVFIHIKQEVIHVCQKPTKVTFIFNSETVTEHTSSFSLLICLTLHFGTNIPYIVFFKSA